MYLTKKFIFLSEMSFLLYFFKLLQFVTIYPVFTRFPVFTSAERPETIMSCLLEKYLCDGSGRPTMSEHRKAVYLYYFSLNVTQSVSERLRENPL